MMPNTIQSREYSRGSDDKGGVLYISAELEWQPLRPVLVLERWRVELERELARQRLERQQPVRGSRNSLHFSSDFSEEFCFTS